MEAAARRAVGSERCAGWSCSPRWLRIGRARAFDTRRQLGQQRLLHALGDVWLADGQYQRHSLERHTPKLVKKLNYRILDGIAGAGQAASQQYGHGAHARYDSWLTPASGWGLS